MNGTIRMPNTVDMAIQEQQKTQDCLREIAEVLKKYDRIMEPIFTVSSKGVSGEIQIIPKQIIKLG